MLNAKLRYAGALAAAALLVSSCALNYAVSEESYRLAAETDLSANQNLFRNIVRASYRHPLHFSSISLVRGGSSGQGSVGITVPFGGAASPQFLLSPGASLSGGPNFELAPLITQEFNRAILTPIPVQTLDYFVSREYQIELLLSLFIDRIEVRYTKAEDKLTEDTATEIEEVKSEEMRNAERMCNNVKNDREKTTTYYNSPRDSCRLINFQKKLRSLIRKGLSTRTFNVLEPATPFMEAAKPTDLGNPLDQAKSNFWFEECEKKNGANRKMRLLKKASITRFCLPESEVLPCAADQGKPIVVGSWEQCEERDNARSTSSNAASRNIEGDISGRSQLENHVFYLRSVHGIIIYLGEIINNIRENKKDGKALSYLPKVRHYNDDRSPIKRESEKDGEGLSVGRGASTPYEETPLFNVVIDERKSGVFVAVDYADRDYFILSGEEQSGNSTEVMAVLTLLLNSFRSSQDLPRTQSVILDR